MAGGVSTKKWNPAMKSLSMQKNAAGCSLLRRPRAPPKLEPIPPSPTPCSYTSEFVQNRYVTPHSLCQYQADESNLEDADECVVPPSAAAPASSSIVSHQLVSRNDLKYILDPFYRTKTSLGTYVEGRPLLQPLKPRGPDALPARVPRKRPEMLSCEFEEELERYYQMPEFTLEDFVVKVSDKEQLPLEQVKQVVFAKRSYKEIQKILADFSLSKQTEVHQVNMSVPDDAIGRYPPPRVPQQQLLIEMAALVKKRISAVLQADMKAVIRPLPRFKDHKTFHPGGTPQPHTEILLYEKDTSTMDGADKVYDHSGMGKITLSDEATMKPDENFISPSEMAILDSLMNAGTSLSLKAHFIAELPSIQAITKTLICLNLSFNNFRMVPFEVFDCHHLVVLKMRNNPIKEISPEISMLRNLRTFVISFCLISTLPPSLFSLKQLEHLDLSYNKVSFIPNEIQHLKNLHTLLIEGNQLAALPCGMLFLRNLTTLQLKNNYMHPYFWKEYSRNSPQRLVDMALLTLTQHKLTAAYTLSEEVSNLVSKYTVCDCCHGPLFGPGLRIIRPVGHIFGIRHLPFLFRSCSAGCARIFKSNTDSLASIVYRNLK